MRAVSTSFRQAVEARFGQEVDLIFVTLSHDQLADPIRVVCDTKDYIRDGFTWTGFPFDIQLLTDDDQPPRATLEIQNVDERIGNTVRPLTSAPRLKIELLHSDDFDLTQVPRTQVRAPAVEYLANHLYLANVKVGAITVSGDIVGWDFTQKTWPGVRATQDILPALFR